MSAHLSDKALLLLRHGDTEGRFNGDGSSIVASVILDAVNRGLHPGYVRRLLADPQHKGGFACFRRRRNLDRWFAEAWKRAEKKVTDSPPVGDRHEATLRATELREQAESLEWKGIGGATDLSVYRYVLDIAAKAGRLGPLGLATRQVADGAGVGREAAGKSLRRLQARGLLRRVSPSTGRAAATYQVMSGRTPDTNTSERSSSSGRTPDNRSHTGALCVGPDCPTYVPSDAWRWGRLGLGLAKARVWAYLSDEALTTAELAGILGVKARTVRRHLAALAEHDLAEPSDEGWIRGPASPDDVAKEIGTAGISEKQRAKHLEERDGHEKARKDYAQAVSEPPFYVDPETGEIIPTDDLLPAPVRPRTPDPDGTGVCREATPDPPRHLALVPPPEDQAGDHRHEGAA